MEYFDTSEEWAISNKISFIWGQKLRIYSADQILESPCVERWMKWAFAWSTQLLGMPALYPKCWLEFLPPLYQNSYLTVALSISQWKHFQRSRVSENIQLNSFYRMKILIVGGVFLFESCFLFPNSIFLKDNKEAASKGSLKCGLKITPSLAILYFSALFMWQPIYFLKILLAWDLERKSLDKKDEARYLSVLMILVFLLEDSVSDYWLSSLPLAGGIFAFGWCLFSLPLFEGCLLCPCQVFAAFPALLFLNALLFL